MDFVWLNAVINLDDNFIPETEKGLESELAMWWNVCGNVQYI